MQQAKTLIDQKKHEEQNRTQVSSKFDDQMTDYKIILTDKYIKEGRNFFLTIEENKPDELINNLVLIPVDKVPEFIESILNEKRL